MTRARPEDGAARPTPGAWPRAVWASALSLAAGCLSPGVASTGASATGTTSTMTTSATTTTSTTSSSSESSSPGATSTGDATTDAPGTTGATTSETSSTSACPFFCEPDGGVGEGRECDPWTQNCGDGQKCTWSAKDGGSALNSTICVPVDPAPVAVGEPCTASDGVHGHDDCAKGAICWGVDPKTQVGHCVDLCKGSEAFCTDHPSACCPGIQYECAIYGGGLAVCLARCHPLTLECPAEGDACYPINDAFQCSPDVSGDMGAVGDPCEYINVCDPATFCGDPAAFPGCDQDADGCCIPFCLLGADECPEGTECTPWYDPMYVPPGYEDLGACVIPK